MKRKCRKLLYVSDGTHILKLKNSYHRTNLCFDAEKDILINFSILYFHVCI